MAWLLFVNIFFCDFINMLEEKANGCYNLMFWVTLYLDTTWFWVGWPLSCLVHTLTVLLSGSSLCSTGPMFPGLLCEWGLKGPIFPSLFYGRGTYRQGTIWEKWGIGTRLRKGISPVLSCSLLFSCHSTELKPGEKIFPRRL